MECDVGSSEVLTMVSSASKRTFILTCMRVRELVTGISDIEDEVSYPSATAENIIHKYKPFIWSDTLWTSDSH